MSTTTIMNLMLMAFSIMLVVPILGVPMVCNLLDEKAHRVIGVRILVLFTVAFIAIAIGATILMIHFDGVQGSILLYIPLWICMFSAGIVPALFYLDLNTPFLAFIIPALIVAYSLVQALHLLPLADITASQT